MGGGNLTWFRNRRSHQVEAEEGAGLLDGLEVAPVDLHQVVRLVAVLGRQHRRRRAHDGLRPRTLRRPQLLLLLLLLLLQLRLDRRAPLQRLLLGLLPAAACPSPSAPPAPRPLRHPGGGVAPLLAHALQQLPRPLAEEDVLPAVGPRRVAREDVAAAAAAAAAAAGLLDGPAVAVQDGLAVVDGLLVRPEEPPVPPCEQAVPRAEGLEAHPVREAAGHQLDGLRDLEGANLGGHEGPVELGQGVVGVGAEAADEVRLGVHQRPQQVVQSGRVGREKFFLKNLYMHIYVFRV